MTDEADATSGPASEAEILELRQAEGALVRASLAAPDAISRADENDLRYLLSFARLTVFQPGAAAAGGRTARPDVSVSEELIAPFRLAVLDELPHVLRVRDSTERLRRARDTLAPLRSRLVDVRRHLIERHANDFSAAELDREVGQRAFVNVAGGGGGAGYVYIGAYERLERAGLVPAFVVGASIGALLGLFRARQARADWSAYLALAKSLDPREIFAAVSLKRRYGVPGLLRLFLHRTIEDAFTRDDGQALRISDLEIPYEAVVAGVRSRTAGALENLLKAPDPDTSLTSLLRQIAGRMWKLTAFFDPRIVKEVVIGADSLTRGFNAVDAAGFSAAIPGVLHYDVPEDDTRTGEILAQLLEREDVIGLVDGGVVNNVPARTAWRHVHEGRIGTRNAFVLAFDCFHPQLDPAHLWLGPITQAVQLQMRRNRPFADDVIQFEPTLSPVNLVPDSKAMDDAIGWGRASIERALPLVERFLEPVIWSDSSAER